MPGWSTRKQDVWMLALYLLAYLPVAIIAVAYGADARIEAIRGPVELIRKNQIHNLSTESPFQAGDVVRTGRSSSVVLKFRNGTVRLGANSTFRLKDVAKDGSLARGSLLYGNFKADLTQATLDLPTTAFTMEKGGFYFHVFPNELDFNRSMVGLLPDGPSLIEVESIKSLPEAFVQVSCIDGDGKFKDSIRVRDEETARVIGKSVDLTPKRVGRDSILASVRAIGF